MTSYGYGNSSKIANSRAKEHKQDDAYLLLKAKKNFNNVTPFYFWSNNNKR